MTPLTLPGCLGQVGSSPVFREFSALFVSLHGVILTTVLRCGNENCVSRRAHEDWNHHAAIHTEFVPL